MTNGPAKQAPIATEPAVAPAEVRSTLNEARPAVNPNIGNLAAQSFDREAVISDILVATIGGPLSGRITPENPSSPSNPSADSERDGVKPGNQSEVDNLRQQQQEMAAKVVEKQLLSAEEARQLQSDRETFERAQKQYEREVRSGDLLREEPKPSDLMQRVEGACNHLIEETRTQFREAKMELSEIETERGILKGLQNGLLEGGRTLNDFLTDERESAISSEGRRRRELILL